MNEMAVTVDSAPMLNTAEDNAGEALPCTIDFFATLSHELRTPLTAIKGFAQGLLVHWDHLPADKQYQYVEHIMRSTLRLERLVYDLSLAARLVDGLSLQSSSIDVAGVVAQAIEECQALHRNREFTVAAPHVAVLVWADHGRVVQVLVNLLDNAAKYSPPDRPIVVRWLTSAAMVQIEVCDSGAGLSLDEQALLFRRFGQVPRAYRNRGMAQGSGLGLFICKALVEAMGGTIGVQAMAGIGNTFWFTLPSATA